MGIEQRFSRTRDLVLELGPWRPMRANHEGSATGGDRSVTLSGPAIPPGSGRHLLSGFIIWARRLDEGQRGNGGPVGNDRGSRDLS